MSFSADPSGAWLGAAVFLAAGAVAVTPVLISWFLPAGQSDFPFWTVHIVFLIWLLITLIVWIF